MSEKLEELRTKLHAKLDGGIDKMASVQNKVSADVSGAENTVKSKLAEIKEAGEATKQKAFDAKNKLVSMVEEKKLETEADIVGWKAEKELKKLEKRADRAENYAETSIEIALCAIAEAEEAVLEAIDARMDVDAVL